MIVFLIAPPARSSLLSPASGRRSPLTRTLVSAGARIEPAAVGDGLSWRESKGSSNTDSCSRRALSHLLFVRWARAIHARSAVRRSESSMPFSALSRQSNIRQDIETRRFSYDSRGELFQDTYLGQRKGFWSTLTRSRGGGTGAHLVSCSQLSQLGFRVSVSTFAFFRANLASDAQTRAQRAWVPTAKDQAIQQTQRRFHTNHPTHRPLFKVILGGARSRGRWLNRKGQETRLARGDSIFRPNYRYERIVAYSRVISRSDVALRPEQARSSRIESVNECGGTSCT